MLDRIAPAFQDLCRQVLPTLPSLSQEEVSTIWGNVSEFVEKQLAMHKGVQISGLGTFTFTRQKLEVGNHKFILVQRPVFIMAEKLVQTHGLKQNKVFSPGDIPVVPLNFVMISLEGPFNRDTIEGCVKETLLFLSRSISVKQNVEFTFKGIGVLLIRDSKVKMRFYKDFLCSMDGSGTLSKALANRPGTMDSVLSSREGVGKRPNSALAFPRIEHKETENKPTMEVIAEEGGEDRPRKIKLKDPTDKEEGAREISSPKKRRDRQSISPAKVTSVSLLDKLERSGSGGKTVTPENVPSPSCQINDNEKPRTSPAPVCQDHNKAGQEMCYVCLQRAQRNFPLYYGDERRRREMEDERLMQQYQILKDQEAFFKNQMKSMAAREQNQKNAAYNLGVAEAIRSHKNEKPEFYNGSHLLCVLNTRLAAQRAQYLKEKMEETQYYKRALDAQVKNKPSQLPMFEPDSAEPIFGKDEGEMKAEKRKREQSCMKHQMEAAASLKRNAILNQLVDQRRDLQMLQRTQREHLADRAAELDRVNRINQCLQEDWDRSLYMKKQRDLEEKAFERASDKLFLLDQCEKYRRCRQCQRRTSNVGESNVWPLNKFLQGSRLLV
ncbi:coiled-coil domain-containing protein 81 [Microtus ochrogaster]|uniref:Coiled-coil domain-containing protein 81 n=1 Tax=Microtus ochrogaster TaxID=79684 RepID=A0ABM1UE13_MICOH|nr:coiled-coil domain-containing protein 81 [Microtus ochrogaster]